MISEYLNRKIRDRLSIAHDIALGGNHKWETISTICDGLYVMFAVTQKNPQTGKPFFAHVSSQSYNLTGYWASELTGCDPKVLQSRATNIDEARRFMGTLIQEGYAETRLINRRKNGDLYGCQILSCKAPGQENCSNPIFFAFFAECATSKCV